MKNFDSVTVSGFETYPSFFSLIFYEFWPEQKFRGWSGARVPGPLPPKKCPEKIKVQFLFYLYLFKRLTPVRRPLLIPSGIDMEGIKVPSGGGFRPVGRKQKLRSEAPRPKKSKSATPKTPGELLKSSIFFFFQIFEKNRDCLTIKPLKTY